MLTLSKEEKARKTELEQLLFECDEMIRTDCHTSGQPLTDDEYKQLWRDIKQYEYELNEIIKKESQLTDETEATPATPEPTATNAFYDCDGGMSSEFFIHNRAKDEGMEM